MIPELQGRFPIRVELKSLTVEDFVRILKEPKNALSKQYIALMETEGIKLTFTDDALEEVAKFAAQVNETSENIGARRLHTIMEKLLEEISFEAPDLQEEERQGRCGLCAEAACGHRQRSGSEPVYSVKKRLALLPLSLVAGGCGYIGETQPPSLHLPAVVQDLSVVEHGDQLVVHFTRPILSTEGLPLKEPARMELHIDDTTLVVPEGTSSYETPAQPYYGRVARIAIKAVSPRNRDAGWSNVVNLPVVPAIAPPAHFEVKAVLAGVQLTWESTEKSFVIFRQAPDEKELAKYDTAATSPYVDQKTVYDKPYRYAVQALQGSAESEMTKAEPYTPIDKFSPAVPGGLAAVVGTQSVELVWERATEPDLAGYRIYRDSGSGQFERIGVSADSPNFSDKTAEKGKRYRYAVTAYDQSGNESGLSEAFEVAVP